MKTATHWETRYKERNTGWDIGYASTPIVNYFEQVQQKNLKILIPGCGNAHEAAHLFKKGFTNIYLLDIANTPLLAFSERNPDFPKAHLINENFFEHKGKYDLIVEQTFFCALLPEHRASYAKKMHELLQPQGKLIGLLFNIPLYEEHPPFGGNQLEYITYFEPYFEFKTFETAYNSIAPRERNELFINFKKKN